MHPSLEIPGRLVGVVLLLLGLVWFFGWRRSNDAKEQQMSPFGGLFGLVGIGLIVGDLSGLIPVVAWKSYGFLMASGCLAVAVFSIHWARKTKLMSVEHMLEMLLITGLCGLLGARLVFLVETWDTRFADRPPIMAAAGILKPLAKGDTLELTTHDEAPFTVTFAGDETSLTKVKEQIEAASASHDLRVGIVTTQHRGEEGVLVIERGLHLKTGRAGTQARLGVLSGEAVAKLGLSRGVTQGVTVPFSEVFNLRAGGLTYFGSVIGVLLSVVIYLRFRKVSLLRMLDLVAPTLPLGLFFGRLGCLAHGCCWGREAGEGALLTVELQPWTPAWAQFASEKLTCNYDRMLNEPAAFSTLPAEVSEALGPLVTSTPTLHATQLYEGLTVLLIFFLAIAYRHWLQRRVGQAFVAVVLMQAPVRLVVEHFRRDHEVFFQLGGYAFTESQIVAITMFSIAVPAMAYLSLKGRLLSDVELADKSSEDVSPEPAATPSESPPEPSAPETT